METSLLIALKMVLLRRGGIESSFAVAMIDGLTGRTRKEQISNEILPFNLKEHKFSLYLISLLSLLLEFKFRS